MRWRGNRAIDCGGEGRREVSEEAGTLLSFLDKRRQRVCSTDTAAATGVYLKVAEMPTDAGDVAEEC